MATTDAARFLVRMTCGTAVLAALVLAAPRVALGQGALTQGIDALFNLRDQLQDTVMKSVKGVADAMNEGGPSAPDGPGESAIDYQLRMYGRLDRFYRGNNDIFNAQQQLMNVNAQLLRQLPKDDPRRAQAMKDLSHFGTQQSAARTSRDDYLKRRNDFGKLIQDYKKRTGSYPPHNCQSAPGWHLPEGASCDGSAAPADPHGTSPHPGPSGHAP